MARFAVKGRLPLAKVWSVCLLQRQETEIERLAKQVDITKQEVLRQMIDYALENMVVRGE